MKAPFRPVAAVCASAALFLFVSASPAAAQEYGSCSESDDLFLEWYHPVENCDDQETHSYLTPASGDVTVNIYKFDFGTGTPQVAAKIAVTGVNTDFDVTINARQISPEEAAALTSANFPNVVCIQTMAPNCVVLEVEEPDPAFFSGPVIVTAFWNSPLIGPGDDVRLLKGPLFGLFDKDITTEVLVLTDEVADLTEDDPGVRGGIGNPPSFSQFLPVFATDDSTNAARLWFAPIDFFNQQLRYDLRADLFRNGVLVSTGRISSVDSQDTLNGATLQTIPMSAPTEPFAAGDKVSLKVSARNACVGSSGQLGKVLLWFNSDPVDSRLTFEGVGTQYLRQLFLHRTLSSNLGLLPRLDFVLVGPPCGSFKTFGTWTTIVH